MRLVLLDELHKNLLHCWTRCPLHSPYNVILLEWTVLTAARFNLSAALMEVWLCKGFVVAIQFLDQAHDRSPHR